MQEKQVRQNNDVVNQFQNPNNGMDEFFDLVPSMLAIISEDGYFKKLNSSWTKVLGHTSEELLSKPFIDFIHPEDVALTFNIIKKRDKNTQMLCFINRFCCKDGSYRFLEWEAAPASHGILYTTVRDITEKKKIEEVSELYNKDLLFLNRLASELVLLTQAEKIEEFLPKQIMSYTSATVAVFSLYDPDKNCLITKHLEVDQYILKKVLELCGSHILGMESPVSPDDYELILDNIIGLRKTLTEVSFGAVPEPLSKAIQLITGIDRFYGIAHVIEGELFGTTVLGYKKGEPGPREELLKSFTHLCAVSLKRIRVESQLKTSEDRFRRFADNARDMIYRMSLPEGVYEYVSSASTEIFGYTPEEFMDRPLLIREVIHPEWRDYFEEQWDLILKGEVSPTHEYQIVHGKTGDSKWLNQRNILIKNDMGEPIAIESIVTDITEQKHSEDVMRNSQKLESIGVLAGGIAHDFNNFLGGLSNNIELAMLKNRDERVSSYLARSSRSIDRANALAGQLLTFAKGGAPIKEVAHLFPFVEETIHFVLSGSSISSRFHIAEDLWPCYFDKNQIGQVVDNIIINAQQAMTSGGTIVIAACNITLSANEHPVLAAGNYIKLSITDHGIGISKESLPNIFDPYFSTKVKGKGLGLATCYSIINRHSGCIDVESELGSGSTFHVYLPASPESSSIQAEKHFQSDCCLHRGSGTFLVMDDEDIILESMKDILEDYGYSVVLTKNGKDAVDFFVQETNKNRKVAGMIFDLTIPGGMGGKEAIREIRNIDSDTPAFVISGYSSDPVIANPLEYGFNASLCKPFKMDDLSKMLEKHIQKSIS